jgi:hypothetical protein
MKSLCENVALLVVHKIVLPVIQKKTVLSERIIHDMRCIVEEIYILFLVTKHCQINSSDERANTHALIQQKKECTHTCSLCV